MIQTWPSSINHLAERGTWSKLPHDPLLRSEFDYGPARQRRRFTRQVTQLSFAVVMTDDEYKLFEGFYHDNLGSGAAWFNMPVWLARGGYEVKRVRFMEPYQAKEAGFRHTRISAKVELMNQPVIDGGSVYFVDQYGEAAIAGINDPLDEIVNNTYPGIMEAY